MFGSGVANFLKQAQAHPLCLGAQPVVFSYTAPKIAGGGSIRISLCGSFWEDGTLQREGLKRPDALVACNAGLSTYPEWTPVILASRAFAIPFAVTDYNEISLRTDIALLEQLSVYDAGSMQLTLKERRRMDAAASRRYEVRLNPFMELGPRPPSLGGISAVNGYEMVVSSV